MNIKRIPKFISKWWKKFKSPQTVKKIYEAKVWGKYTPAEWVFLAFGGLLIFYLLINLLTSFGDKSPQPQTTSLVSLRDINTFERTLAGVINSSVENLGNIEILENGAQFLPDLLAEIEKAQETIHITNYIWDDGEFGKILFDALIQKQKEGIEVRILLDGIGGRKANEESIRKLTMLGGQVATFRPVRWWNITRIHRRTHLRDIVIDGQIAYFGGIAISDLWLGNADTPESWQDYMFKLDGNAAVRGEKIFADIWAQTTGEIISAQENLPSSPDPLGNSTFVSFFSVPSPDMAHHMEYFIWLTIEAAEESIYIENPYILPSDSLLKALEKKAREGVDVKIIVPSEKTDARHVRWASQSFYRDLLDAGVKIYEYAPSRIHSKIIIADHKWSVIGSANLDSRSREINLEALLGIDDENFAKELEKKFSEDLSLTDEVTREEWTKVSPITKILLYISRIFIKQY